jgi:hypothetical protein
VSLYVMRERKVKESARSWKPRNSICAGSTIRNTIWQEKKGVLTAL